MRQKKDQRDEPEAEINAEDEAPLDGIGQTLIVVPTDLLPAIRELIEKHKRDKGADAGEAEA